MKISIITVVYNAREVIGETIQSVLSQSYGNLEYLVIDGRSTDGTRDVLAQYQDKISNCVSEPDNGIYDAMNKGIKLATGDVVGFLNAGDIYASGNVIEKVVESIQAYNADCCYGDLKYVAENNPDKTVRRWKSQSYRDGLFEKGWHPPHPTFFCKKSVFDQYGGFDISYEIGADYELMLRFLQKHGISSCYIPSVLVKMRTGGISNKSLWQIIKANIECFRAWRQNGLKVTPLLMLKKPTSKLVQYIKRSSQPSHSKSNMREFF